jgi:hypothetical protein
MPTAPASTFNAVYHEYEYVRAYNGLPVATLCTASAERTASLATRRRSSPSYARS